MFISFTSAEQPDVNKISQLGQLRTITYHSSSPFHDRARHSHGIHPRADLSGRAAVFHDPAQLSGSRGAFAGQPGDAAGAGSLANAVRPSRERVPAGVRFHVRRLGPDSGPHRSAQRAGAVCGVLVGGLRHARVHRRIRHAGSVALPAGRGGTGRMDRRGQNHFAAFYGGAARPGFQHFHDGLGNRADHRAAAGGFCEPALWMAQRVPDFRCRRV